MNYFPWHIGDYAAHTGHLEPMEDLIYRRLLDAYYLREGALPADIQVTAKLIRLRSVAEDVEAILNEFFVLTEEGWTHSRCDEEIAKMQDKQAKARDAAEQSVKSRRAAAERRLLEQQAAAERALASAPTDVELPTPTPTPTPKKKEEEAPLPLAFSLPSWIPKASWIGYVEMRTRQRKPMTDRARDLKVAELKRMHDKGYDVGAVLDKSTANCWTDIYEPKNRDGAGQPQSSFV